MRPRYNPQPRGALGRRVHDLSSRSGRVGRGVECDLAPMVLPITSL